MLELTDTNFGMYLGQAKVLFVDLWASWCRPCQAMAPVFEKLAGEFKDKVTFAKVNVEQNPSVAASLEVRSIPMLILFKDGKEADRLMGATDESGLRSWLNDKLK